MKRLKFFVGLLTLLVLFSFSFSITEEEAIVQRLEKEIVPLINKDRVRFNIPGLSVALVSRGKIIWKKGFGYRDREENLAATPETIYRVGSISKLFNAVAIIRESEKGRLNLDVPLEKYCPQIKFKNKFTEPAEISLRHLITHRAGILRESPVGHYFDDSEPSLKATAESMKGTPLIYPPGTRTKYSNIGVGISGYVLEKVSQIDYCRYLKKFVLNPLGMKASSFSLKDISQEKLAKGYMRDLAGQQWEAPHFRFGYIPAANLYSSVIELSKFVNFILNEGQPLLSKKAFQEMVKIQFNRQGASVGFGLGFHISKIHGYRTIGHNGAVYGFSSNLLVIPEEKLGVVVCNNLDGANGFNYKLVNYILGIALEVKTGQKLVEIPKIKVLPEEELKIYEGKYKGPGEPLWIVAKEGHLFYQPYGAARELDYLGQDVFITDDLLGYGEKIVFKRKGKAIEGLEINGNFYRKVEVKEEKNKFPTEWRELLGEYGPDFNIMKVYVKDGRLIVLIEWFYEYPLLPERGLKFKFPDYGLYMGEEVLFRKEGERVKDVLIGAVCFKKRD